MMSTIISAMRPTIEMNPTAEVNPIIARTPMNLNAQLSVANDVLFVEGQINFTTVTAICDKGLQLMSTMQQVIVDLQKLEFCDSSGLALCTAWMRKMRADKKSLVFINLPSFMHDLVRVHGLDAILSIRVI